VPYIAEHEKWCTEFYKGGVMAENEPKKIKVYYSPTCRHCDEVLSRVKDGKVETDLQEDVEIQLLDVTSDVDLTEIQSEELDSVPSAKMDGKTCKLLISEVDDKLLIKCRDDKEAPDAE